MHAGNLFVTPDGRVAFLHFGITGRVAPGVRDGATVVGVRITEVDEPITAEAARALTGLLRRA